jgi:hypothetical protein
MYRLSVSLSTPAFSAREIASIVLSASRFTALTSVQVPLSGSPAAPPALLRCCSRPGGVGVWLEGSSPGCCWVPACAGADAELLRAASLERAGAGLSSSHRFEYVGLLAPADTVMLLCQGTRLSCRDGGGGGAASTASTAPSSMASRSYSGSGAPCGHADSLSLLVQSVLSAVLPLPAVLAPSPDGALLRVAGSPLLPAAAVAVLLNDELRERAAAVIASGLPPAAPASGGAGWRGSAEPADAPAAAEETPRPPAAAPPVPPRFKLADAAAAAPPDRALASPLAPPPLLLLLAVKWLANFSSARN